MADTPVTTPKRKRGVDTSLTPVIFKFDPSRTPATDDGGESPRSKVAHKFRGLALEGADEEGEASREGRGTTSGGGGGGVAPSEAGDGNHFPLNKRVKADEVMHEAPADTVTDEPEKKGVAIPEPEVVADDPTLQQHLPLPEGSLQRAYPSINRLSESKSRGKKRSGTPPPEHQTQAFAGDDDKPEENEGDLGDQQMEIVDPIRAALTWREDEITIYDPEDEDDDGTGINGVGFKPTPALAQARVMKRRQQLAEYRKREENEARAKRSQRRRGAPRGGTPSPEQRQARRKVRFTDNDKPAFIVTES